MAVARARNADDRRCDPWGRGAAGQRPENLTYDGSAESLQDVWIALRANIRAVLEQVTLADVASGRLPKQVAALAREPTAWTSG